MTNADVIRQMSDEELYKFLQAIEIGDIDYSLTFCSYCKEDNQLDCDECLKRWLFGDADDYNGLLKYKGRNSGYADRKTENSSEKPNNCDTCKYGEDKHRYAHICNECGVGINNYEPKTFPTISKMEQVDEPQSNADQRIQNVESVESVEQTERSE